MSNLRNDRPDLSRESERFVKRLREGYAPETPSDARAQAFDAALRERLDAPRRESWWKPALIASAVAAAIGWLLMPGTQTQLPGEAPLDVAREPETIEQALAEIGDAAGAADWQAELLGTSELDDFEASPDDEFLPDEYLAIAGAFFEG